MKLSCRKVALGVQSDVIQYGHVFPRGPVMQGVYLDDYGVACVVDLRHLRLLEGPDYERVERTRQVYKAHNLATSDEKGIRLRDISACCVFQLHSVGDAS